MRSKVNRSVANTILICVLAAISLALPCFFPIKGTALFKIEMVVAVIGLMLGFGLTIFTFILQLIPGIVSDVRAMFPEKSTYGNEVLRSSLNELKDNLWAMFLALAIAFVGSLVGSIDRLCPWFMECSISIAESCFVFAYLFSAYAFTDLIKSLFTIGDIVAFLLDKKNK